MKVPCGGGSSLDGPLIMGILNVTPDSFSDGGSWTDVRTAVRHALDMVDQGADIIDVGGESTRPYSDPVGAEEELSRLVPVLRDLVPSVDVPVSVDTMKARVAEVCLGLGADIVNDVYGLRDPGMLELCAGSDAAVVIMHMEGMPGTMQDHPLDTGDAEVVRGFLEGRVAAAEAAGIRRDRIILDPGMGFGKTSALNRMILGDCRSLCGDFPVLAGSSRKRFLSDMFPGMDRDSASAKAARISVAGGADVVRVHDVARAVELIRG